MGEAFVSLRIVNTYSSRGQIWFADSGRTRDAGEQIEARGLAVIGVSAVWSGGFRAQEEHGIYDLFRSADSRRHSVFVNVPVIRIRYELEGER